MFKVMIIDDEPIIRKGLRNIINWRQFDCEVVSEAADGQAGIEMIKTVLPDILITDIRMPDVDGLTMIKEVKSLIPESKIIILTGYRDFEYVQEAIKLGVFDYILKPSKIEELTSIIIKAVKELKYYREKSEEIDKLKLLFEKNVPILKEKFLYDIIYEININNEDIIEKMNLFQIEIEDYILIVVENESPEGSEKELSQYDRQLYKFGIINSFNEIFTENFHVTSIPLNDAWVAFLIQLNDKATTFEEFVNDKCLYLQKIIQSCFGFTVSLAISSQGKSILELPMKFKECREALEHKFYIGNNSILEYNDLNAFFKYKDYSMLEKLQKLLIEGIKTGNLKVVKENLNDTYTYIESLGNIEKQYLKDFYWNTISMINNIRVSVLDADNTRKSIKKDIESLNRMIERCENVKSLHTILEDIAMDIARKVYTYNNKSIKLVLRKAMDYIQENYHNQVTLNEVAEHTYVSTYYISRIFKKELGKNFIDYLNEIRIENAKELLRDIRYKTYEVAEKVGIPDAHYFSKLFKKYEGVTPTEYKDSIKL